MTMIEDVGTMYAVLIDPDGVQWPLTEDGDEPGWFTPGGVAGWGATDYELATDPVPRGGDNVRFIRAQPGRVTWPLYVGGQTHLEFVSRLRTIKKAFMSTVHRGLPAILRVSRPDGTAREIEFFYEDGWQLAGDAHLFAKVALTLFCPDGYWRDAAATVIRRVQGAGVNFLNPYPQTSSSQVLGESEADNPGDVQAWPSWTVTGPMTSLVATNVTTGRAFTLTHTLSTGQTITIETLQPAVTGPAGVNLVGALNWPTAYLWPLEPGVNEVEFVANGSGTGTSVELSFRARYEGA